MKKPSGLPFLLIAILSACAAPAAPVAWQTETESQSPSRTLTVFAAASLTEAFQEIGRNFEAIHPNVTVMFNFANAQTLLSQLEQGAVADVFASASHVQIDMAVKDGLILQGAPKDFISNILIVILPANNPANICGLQDLARPGLKLILADKTVPAGNYARQVLDKMSKDPSFGTDFSTKALANVVTNETNVKQVVIKVQLGEADAGIVYISDSIAAPQLKTIEIPANYNVVAVYPIAALTKAPNPDLANAFIAYVLSSDGQTILKKWGFTPLRP